jgi:indole-3-glycerol phosphate synthase
MTKTILDKIIADKKTEVARIKRQVPIWSLRERARLRKPLDFAAALRWEGVKLIAEVKKASPSKGLLCPDFKPVEIAKTYARHGAAAISVLTESSYFQGSLDYLEEIRKAVNIPLLRKDFIFDDYQVYESAAYGADAILLITAMLEQKRLEELMTLCKELGLGYLVEVHNEDELQKALLSGAEIIGINNRDLNTFKVDINTTRRLRFLIPPENIVVSESGINTKDDIKTMKECRVNAVLVGEALVTAKDIPAKMEELLS